MNLSRYKMILLPLLLSACAQMPHDNTKVSADTPPPQANTSTQASANTEAKLDLPNVELSSQILFEFLLGDVAMQRGRPQLAAQAYLDLAKKTRDPRIARHAAQLAFKSHKIDISLQAFALWQDLEPSSALAKQMLISLLLSGGKLQEAKPHIESLLALAPKRAASVFVLMNTLLPRVQDKAAALNWLSDIARPYPKLAEAHWAVAQIASLAGDKKLALNEIQQAVSLRPEWGAALEFEAQLLMSSEPQRGLAMLQEFLKTYQDNKEVRLYYARALLKNKQYSESRAQFQQLLATNPDNVELAFAIALISLQMGELDRAETELQETLQKGKKDADTVHYYLAQLNEAKQDNVTALSQYRQVIKGGYEYAARLREAYLLNKAGELNKARDALGRAPLKNDQQRVTVKLIEAQMLRDAKQYKASYRVLLGTLQEFPNSPKLLFETAMIEDRLGKSKSFEKTLRKLLRIDPNHAHAYNALGYSLLDRNVRLEEGMSLVKKAYALEPDDVAITDSMGWGYYRLGKLDESVAFLRRAYNSNPDPEIAAHLGEALWAQGHKDEAKLLLQNILKIHPDDRILRALIKKYIH